MRPEARSRQCSFWRRDDLLRASGDSAAPSGGGRSWLKGGESKGRLEAENSPGRLHTIAIPTLLQRMSARDQSSSVRINGGVATGKKFARRMPGENDANGACYSYTQTPI